VTKSFSFLFFFKVFFSFLVSFSRVFLILTRHRYSITPFASNKINIPISETLTPNQKCNFLFNINEPFELSMEEFGKEW